MNTEAPFFILTPAEAIVAADCVALFKDTNDHYEPAKWDDAVKALYKKICRENIDRDIPLNKQESGLLLFGISQSSSFLNFSIQYFRERNHYPDKYVVMLTQFENFKKDVPALLWRLTQALGYIETGLETLENIYKFKTGVVRPLKIDNTMHISSINIQDLDVATLQLFFSVIDLLEVIQDRSEFAKRVFSHQYFHVTDYAYIRDKYFPRITIGNSVKMTAYSSVMFYWISAVMQRMFVSDAAGYFEKTIFQGSSELFQKTRDLQFVYITNMQNKIRNSLREDKEALPYLEMVNRWEYPVDI